MLLIARRGVVRLVKQLRKQRDQGDRRGFMDMILDAAQLADGEIAKVNAMGGGEGGGAMTMQLLDDVASANAGVEALTARVESLGDEMADMRKGLNRLLEKHALEPVGVAS